MQQRHDQTHRARDLGSGQKTQVSAAIGNSRTMTVGVCCLNPGCHNARQYHPNCDEVLVVKSGRIIHTLGEEEREMETGDVIVIPTGVMHNARNIGDEPAELGISFSSAYRQTILDDLELDAGALPVTLSAIPSNP